MLLNDARRAARVDASGRYVAFGDQDRALWDEGRIREGRRALDRALQLRRAGPYQLQAAITALHLEAPGVQEADWAQIAELYRALAELAPSPVVDVNRAVAVAFASGPDAGLEMLAPLLDDTRLRGYQPLHAAHAELLRRSGDDAGAARAYERAIELSANDVERAELERRLRELTGD
jgi:RNA polymerase sigma-70 factor, ECF subfamily